MGREKKEAGGVGGGGEIDSNSVKTSQKKYDMSKKHSKQAIRQGKLRKITKCLLTRFS